MFEYHTVASSGPTKSINQSINQSVYPAVLWCHTIHPLNGIMNLQWAMDQHNGDRLCFFSLRLCNNDKNDDVDDDHLRWILV